MTVAHGRSALRASKVRQSGAFVDDKIAFAFGTEVAELKQDGAILGGVVLRDGFTGATRELAAAGLFIAIGPDPRTELFHGQLDLDEEGHLRVASPITRTNFPGVFGAGDVADHTYRQAIAAVGSGASVALVAERNLTALALPQVMRWYPLVGRTPCQRDSLSRNKILFTCI